MKKIYFTIGKLLPKGFRTRLKNMIEDAELKTVPEEFIGFSLFFGLLLGFASAYVFYVLAGLSLFNFFIIFLGVSFSFIFLSYGSIILIIDRKLRFVDEVLPDVLSLTAANIRSGISPDKALLLAAKPEFGYLEKYIKESAKKALAGESFESALSSITKKIKSKMLERAIILINEGMKYGGELASILEETASEIRDLQILNKEIKSVVMMYVIFIFMAAVIGSPLLYSISTFMIETITSLGSVAMPETSLTMMGVKTSITPEFLFNFSLAAIIINTIFAGMLLGLIYQGKEKMGIKYVPIMLIISLTIFFVVRNVITSMLGAYMF